MTVTRYINGKQVSSLKGVVVTEKSNPLTVKVLRDIQRMKDREFSDMLAEIKA